MRIPPVPSRLLGENVRVTAGEVMREERRVVTALAADVVGSTSLAERLDPEEARLVIGDAVARMVHAVEEFGGTVKDLAGDGVLVLFGAPTAHEDDSERALRAALRLVDDVVELAHEVERSFGLTGFGVRVGVNTGTVIVGPVGAGSRVEYGATGDAVNVAARLQVAAPPGGILVGAETQALARTRFSWSEPRELELKGKADPVDASALEAVAALKRTVSETRLVGRDQGLATASRALDEPRAGSGAIFFVTGEPGIPRVLLATAAPLGVENERGWVCKRGVRRPDRTRATGAQRPRAARAVSRPIGWPSPIRWPLSRFATAAAQRSSNPTSTAGGSSARAQPRLRTFTVDQG